MIPSFVVPLPLQSGFTPSVAQVLLMIALSVTNSSLNNVILPIPKPFDYLEYIVGINPITQQETVFGAYFYSDQFATEMYVFSGTSMYSEWLEDMNFFQTRPIGINNLISIGSEKYVHRGFYNIYMAIQVTVRKAHKINATQTIVVGHSLGGAIATLAIVDLYVQDSSPMFLYTFGSPRVGNPDFVNLFDHLFLSFHNVYRVYNTEDIVTTLPFPVWGSILYSHVGTAISFTANLGSLVLNHIQAYINFLS
jgi:triacylglycerol lipase